MPLRAPLFVSTSILLLAPSAAFAQRRAAVPDDWLTQAERTQFAETGDYEDTRAYAKKLDEASPWIRLLSFGTSPQGRDLMLIVASKDEAFDPESARRAGKPVVLVQNAIHAGEIEGKDASLMLLRDIAVTKERESLLDGVTLLVMPLFNVDGYARFGPYTRINQNGPRASGWRTTARNLNLNRDYMKADAPEMQDWLEVYDAWKPDLLIDNHTTDGADYEYVITFSMESREDVPASVGAWERQVFLPYLMKHVESAGYPAGPYLEMRDPLDPAKGFQELHTSGRYSSGYTPLRNRPSLLVETHMLKTYEPRVRSTYETMVAALEVIGRNPSGLHDAIAAAEAEASRIGATAQGDSLTLTFDTSDSAGTLDYRGLSFRHEPSEISGAMRVRYGTDAYHDSVPFYNRLTPEKKVRPPLGYLIPVQWGELAERLKLHGVPVERLEKPVTGTFEFVRFKDVDWEDEPFEGRHRVSFETERVMEADTFPAGSYWVPLANPSARIAMHLLEPEGPDSFVAWGFLNAIFERKEYAEAYVMERMAREMLERDPKLREEFYKKLREDEEFRADPEARLTFFYEHTPFWDPKEDRYPIARVVTPLDR